MISEVAAGAGEINIAAAVILDPEQRVLLVRKRDTSLFMQPGGKMEGMESPRSCLARELQEELGLRIEENRMHPLGRFSAPAANEVEAVVQADLFLVRGVQAASPAAEIAEAVWCNPLTPDLLPLAPLTADIVMPLVSRIIDDSTIR